jgi:hypothetical protein
MRWLSLPVAALLLALLVPWLTRGLAAAVAGTHGWPQDPWHLAAGLALGAALAWWKRPNWLLHTWLHESCHALMCAALLVPVRSFQATDGEGGAVLHDRTDWPRTVLIAIAPYILPLLLGPALLLQELLPRATRPGATFAVGLLAVQHLTGLFHNLRLNWRGDQGDLVRTGRWLSVVLVWSGLLALGWVMVRVLWR